jgi:2-C-methyl-D-erythritol 2,4-cyclodiphosphate synthase
MKIRVGFGYDVHKLESNIPFHLGGIHIEHSKGAVGHSDADVLIHAICDAMLGAANLRDIGYHFADTNPDLKGVDSKIILAETLKLIESKGFRIVNIDSVVCLQRPRLMDIIPYMQITLASVLKMDMEDISIKATTTEKLGFVGNEEGVAAYAVVLIQKD